VEFVNVTHQWIRYLTKRQDLEISSKEKTRVLLLKQAGESREQVANVYCQGITRLTDEGESPSERKGLYRYWGVLREADSYGRTRLDSSRKNKDSNGLSGCNVRYQIRGRRLKTTNEICAGRRGIIISPLLLIGHTTENSKSR